MPFPATITVPDFALLRKPELKILFNDLRWPLATQVFMLLVLHSDFKTGNVPDTSYARLMELCTPPTREKGGRGKGPTRDQLRYVVEQLIVHRLVKRNNTHNENQGTLKLTVAKRTTQAPKKSA